MCWFADHDLATPARAEIPSLGKTCKLSGVDSHALFKTTLEQIEVGHPNRGSRNSGPVLSNRPPVNRLRPVRALEARHSQPHPSDGFCPQFKSGAELSLVKWLLSKLPTLTFTYFVHHPEHQRPLHTPAVAGFPWPHHLPSKLQSQMEQTP